MFLVLVAFSFIYQMYVSLKLTSSNKCGFLMFLFFYIAYTLKKMQNSARQVLEFFLLCFLYVCGLRDYLYFVG